MQETLTTVKDELKQKIGARTARVGVVGLGYVGLPLAAEFARQGLAATGFEVDQAKADAVNRGESYIADVRSAQLSELIEAKTLRATTDFSELAGCDAI